MKTLYLDCSMGAAGDMMMAALLELISDKQNFIKKMNSLGLPGVEISYESSQKCKITGIHVNVIINGQEEESLDHAAHEHEYLHEEAHTHSHSHDHDGNHDGGHAHHHSSMEDIRHIISHMDIPDKVRKDVLAVYQLIAEAESHVHGSSMEQIHFHEVGSLDAVADITGVCLLMDMLAPDKVAASPVCTGTGQVRCAHGILPVPAPATAYILRDIPVYGGTIRGELCTPTGAALLKHFVTEFGSMPVMQVKQIGYGMGKKDFEAANCLRALYGETSGTHSEIVELCCNLDDMTPEAIGFAQERLFENGALDVYTTAIGMKKNRPGILLSCMCHAEKREEMLRLIFKYTTTLGIREYTCRRYILERSQQIIETEYGPVHIKESKGFGVSRQKAEYEDLARIARQTDSALWDHSFTR